MNTTIVPREVWQRIAFFVSSDIAICWLRWTHSWINTSLQSIGHSEYTENRFMMVEGQVPVCTFKWYQFIPSYTPYFALHGWHVIIKTSYGYEMKLTCTCYVRGKRCFASILNIMACGRSNFCENPDGWLYRLPNERHTTFIEFITLLKRHVLPHMHGNRRYITTKVTKNDVTSSQSIKKEWANACSILRK